MVNIDDHIILLVNRKGLSYLFPGEFDLILQVLSLNLIEDMRFVYLTYSCLFSMSGE